MLKEKTFQDQWIIFVTIPIINTAYQAKKVFKMSYFWILLLNWRDPCYEWALLWFMCNVKICALCKILARSYRRREAEKKKEGTRAKLTSLSLHMLWMKDSIIGDTFSFHNGSKLMGDNRKFHLRPKMVKRPRPSWFFLKRELIFLNDALFNHLYM